MIKSYLNKQTRVFIVLLLVLIYFNVSGQNLKVTGTVTSASDNNPLPGVNILIKGTSVGSITDIDGNYSITLPDLNSVLVFSYVGYVQQEISVNGRQVIDVSMAESVLEMDQIVVVGYGTQKKSDLTGAVTVVNTKHLEKVTSSNIANVLQGQASGVQVQSSGEPGAVPKVKIRGIGSFQNTEPLYVIDGVPVANSFSVRGGG